MEGTMTTRKRYVDQMAATLLEWSAQIADLQWRAKSASAERQAQIGEQVAALRSRWAAYDQRQRTAKDMSAAVFRDMRGSADRIAAEFRKIYVQAASRFAS
jgi:hypothetical protein